MLDFLFLGSTLPHKFNISEIGMCLPNSACCSYSLQCFIFVKARKVMVHPNQDSSNLIQLDYSYTYSTSHWPGIVLTALHVLTH